MGLLSIGIEEDGNVWCVVAIFVFVLVGPLCRFPGWQIKAVRDAQKRCNVLENSVCLNRCCVFRLTLSNFCMDVFDPDEVVACQACRSIKTLGARFRYLRACLSRLTSVNLEFYSSPYHDAGY